MNTDKEDRGLGDERVLGGGAFVKEVLDQAEVPIRQPGRDVGAILAEVCREHAVGQEFVLGRTRRRPVVWARDAFLLRAHEQAGESFTALGRLCTMSHTSVRAAIARAMANGEKRRSGEEAFVSDQRTPPFRPTSPTPPRISSSDDKQPIR